MGLWDCGRQGVCGHCYIPFVTDPEVHQWSIDEVSCDCVCVCALLWNTLAHLALSSCKYMDCSLRIMINRLVHHAAPGTEGRKGCLFGVECGPIPLYRYCLLIEMIVFKSRDVICQRSIRGGSD